MTLRTREELQAAINVIRNESAIGANTRERIATILQDVSDSAALANAPLDVNGTPVSQVNTDQSLDYSTAAGVTTLKSARKEVLFKSSGTSDDGARLQALADSLIGTGSTIILAPGTFHQTVEMRPHRDWPSFRGNKNVRWICNQTKIASHPTPAAFYFVPSYDATATTLYAAAAVNDRKLTLTSVSGPSIVKGSVIELSGTATNFGTMYRVTGDPVVNGSAWDVPIDRPVLVPSASGVTVQRITEYVEDWEFDGDGMSMSGVTCRYFSLSRHWNSKVKSIIFDDADGTASDLLSWDNCGVDNLCENLRWKQLNGTHPDTGGLLCETNEGTVFRDNDIQFGARITVPALAMDSSIGCRSERSKWSAAMISCEQAGVALGNEINGGQCAWLTFGQTSTTHIPWGTRIIKVAFVGQPTGVWSNYVYPVVPTVRTLFEDCVFNLPNTRGYGVNLLDQPQDMRFVRCDFTSNKTTVVALGQADVPVGIGPGSGAAHTISLDWCKFSDCEAVTFSGTTLKLTATNSDFDHTHVGSASIGLFRLYGTTVDARFTNCTGTPAGSYAAINGTTTATYLFTDTNFGGTWLTAGGTSTGYRRGQTTVTPSGGTFPAAVVF